MYLKKGGEFKRSLYTMRACVIMIKIASSLLACDFSKIGKEIAKIEFSGTDMIHLDVMDGRFVPNITFGAPVIKSIRKSTALPFDTHLMIENPLEYVTDFANAGSDIITFHIESNSNAMKTIEKIKNHGKKVGISLKPKTNIEILKPYLNYVDVVLIMTVEPGFGGQEFLEDQLEKVLFLKKEAVENNLNFQIALDGGINLETIKIVRAFPVDICVSGTCIFNSDAPKDTISNLKGK